MFLVGVSGFEPEVMQHCVRITYGVCPHSLCAARKPLGDGNQEASGFINKKTGLGITQSCVFGRSVGIRTRGLLDPNQARYQTSPHPDSQVIIVKILTVVKSYRSNRIISVIS